jgi:hypothetical protein
MNDDEIDATKDDEAAFAANADKLRQRMKVRVAEIKSALATWIEPRNSEADNVCMTNALLETALDRHIAVHEANGFDLIESAYQRALKRSQGPLMLRKANAATAGA